jgi:hypothetical protein
MLFGSAEPVRVLLPLDASSLRMVPSALAVAIVVPALGPDRLTVKFSSASAVASPAMPTVIVLEV